MNESFHFEKGSYRANTAVIADNSPTQETEQQRKVKEGVS
jgi:hypothetical protein